MVEFIKNSSNYGLYIVESSCGGDNWLDDHDHIKELDGDLITSGSNGVYLPYSGSVRTTPNFKINIIDFFEGAGFDITLGTGHWAFYIKGRYGGTSEAVREEKMEDLMQMFMRHLKFTEGALYLGYRKVGEVWKAFINPDGDSKPYLRGKLLFAEPSRLKEQNFYNWKVVFRGVWNL